MHSMEKSFISLPHTGCGEPSPCIQGGRAIEVGGHAEQSPARRSLDFVRAKHRVEAAVTPVPAPVVLASESGPRDRAPGEKRRDIQPTAARLPEPPDPVVVFEGAHVVFDALESRRKPAYSLQQLL